MTHLPNWQKLGNPDFFRIIEQRAKIIKFIRRFFDERGFLEVETPKLVKLPGQEPHLHPFETRITRPDGEKVVAYLITSPEYHMKKLVCGGLEKIYQLTTSFRDNEELSPLHNPEFTMLEWYRVNANYMDIARDLENLIHSVCHNLTDNSILCYDELTIDLSPPFEYLSVEESFNKFLGLDLTQLFSDKEGFVQTAANQGFGLNSSNPAEEIFHKLFLTYVEPELGRVKPTILFDYPASMAALSRLKQSDERWAERFELYLGGVEIANAFSELTDWSVQFERLKKERDTRERMGRETFPIDSSFIDALKSGMPPCGGIALGVDRLIMVLLGKKSIEEVMLFPGKDIF